jgi:hypothetical protein
MDQPSSKPVSNRTIRLAECESIAVDLCPCGTMQVHLGALSLRFHAESVGRLVETLGAALARRQALVCMSDMSDMSRLDWNGAGRAPGNA